MRRPGFLNQLLASIAAGALASTPVQAQEPAAPLAVWQPVSIVYDHRGVDSAYRCDAAEWLIKYLLTYFRAHPDTTVDLRGCHGTDVGERFLVVIDTAVPVARSEYTAPADARTLEVASTLGLETMSDAFPVRRMIASTKGARRVRLTAHDCELLDGMLRNVFPALKITTSPPRLECPLGGSLREPYFEAEVWVPIARSPDP